MRLDVVKPGDTVEIILKTSDDDEKTYECDYQFQIDDKHCVINFPVENNKPVRIPLNELMVVVFLTAHGMVQFSCVAKSYENYKGLELIAIEVKSQGVKAQRRSYFRYQCDLPLVYYIYEDEKGNMVSIIADGHEISSGKIVELSGGGLRFMAYGAIPENVHITCSIMLEDVPILALGEVLKMSYNKDEEIPYEFRVKFIGITQRDQDAIVQYIFDRQTLMLEVPCEI